MRAPAGRYPRLYIFPGWHMELAVNHWALSHKMLARRNTPPRKQLMRTSLAITWSRFIRSAQGSVVGPSVAFGLAS